MRVHTWIKMRLLGLNLIIKRGSSMCSSFQNKHNQSKRKQFLEYLTILCSFKYYFNFEKLLFLWYFVYFATIKNYSIISLYAAKFRKLFVCYFFYNIRSLLEISQNEELKMNIYEKKKEKLNIIIRLSVLKIIIKKGINIELYCLSANYLLGGFLMKKNCSLNHKNILFPTLLELNKIFYATIPLCELKFNQLYIENIHLFLINRNIYNDVCIERFIKKILFYTIKSSLFLDFSKYLIRQILKLLDKNLINGKLYSFYFNTVQKFSLNLYLKRRKIILTNYTKIQKKCLIMENFIIITKKKSKIRKLIELNK